MDRKGDNTAEQRKAEAKLPLKKIEKLSIHIARPEERNDKSGRPAQVGASMAALEELERKLQLEVEEKNRLAQRCKEVEKENQDFAGKYSEMEEENNMLGNLYIASHQLHSTLDFSEVLSVIMEIVINLVGAEEFAIYLVDEKTHLLKAVASEGLMPEELPMQKVGEGVVGNVVKTGEEHFREDLSILGTTDLKDPLVCIPMKIQDRVIGALVIFKLLKQKDSFCDLDYEMFSMLAGHTATAVFSSKLYTESERKLSTIQGFIDLLTKK